MNEHELDHVLGAIGADRTRVQAPPVLRERVRAVPVEASPRRGWLPRIDRRGFDMLSALKFVAASVIVALFGGFLLSGILTTQQDGEVPPGAMTESPAPTTPEASIFPTGSLVSVEQPYLLLVFNEDGTGSARNASVGWDVSLVYATHDDLYTEMWSDAATQAPVTYFWDFDGEHLTMRPWSPDPDDIRRSVYADNTWVPIEDPVAVVVAPRDIEAGQSAYAMMGFVPAAETGEDVFTATHHVFSRVASVPISKGQVITADMLEPPTE